MSLEEGVNLIFEDDVDVIDSVELEEQKPSNLPFSFASEKGVLYKKENDGGCLYHRDNLQLSTLAEVRRYIRDSFRTELLEDDEFKRQLTLHYQTVGGEAEQLVADFDQDIDLLRLAEEIPETNDLMSGEDDAPVIRLINAILSQAVQEKASDIHIETFENSLMVRYRVDGVLREVLQPRRLLAPLLVSRLKVMAKLDIAEKRIPQDGRISVKIAGHGIDIRVSTIPATHGERIVLRLLDKDAGRFDLPELNMSDAIEEGFSKCLHMPHGILLVTGPTGSGKTTSLYAGLTHINDSSRNILTIEDPVEYMLPGVGQTQVNSKVEMTFSRGLRAILRQDPDVVMIGEIRDKETADIAVQASLTGHLVMSTLHTNTAIGAITRLQDMGVESFLISSSLVGVMAQRLVRVLCKSCRKTENCSEREMQLMRIKKIRPICKPVGCKECNYSGYKGRTGIYELIKIDEEMRLLIHENASEQEMTRLARTQSPSIFAHGVRRILLGETSIEEVLRVTSG